MHHTPNAVELLCEGLAEGEFLIAQVRYYDPLKRVVGWRLTGTGNPRPFFFLGSLWRNDLYAVGGNDEDFKAPGYDDNWFADCLIKGLGLRCRFVDQVVGYHQIHARPANLDELVAVSKRVYEEKVAAGEFVSSGGPWNV
jgi:hypothetical protein